MFNVIFKALQNTLMCLSIHTNYNEIKRYNTNFTKKKTYRRLTLKGPQRRFFEELLHIALIANVFKLHLKNET